MLHVPQLLKLKNGLVPVVKPRFLVGLLKRNLNQTPLFLLTYPAFPVGLAHLVLYFPFALHRLLKTYKIRVPLSPYSILYYHCSNFGIIFRKKVRIIRLDQRCDRTCRTLFFMHYGRIFDWKRGYLCIFRCNCIFDSYFSDRLFYTI